MMTKLWWLRRQWLVVWYGSRYPLRRKSAKTGIVMWSLALTSAVLVLMLHLFLRTLNAWTLFTVALGVFDFIMLHRNFEGLMWLRGREEKLRRAGGPQEE